MCKFRRLVVLILCGLELMIYHYNFTYNQIPFMNTSGRHSSLHSDSLKLRALKFESID